MCCFHCERLRIRDLHAPALVLAGWNHSQVMASLAQVANAQLIVVATPVYKAAYSGLLKVFLDLLPQTAFAGKAALPLATVQRQPQALPQQSCIQRHPICRPVNLVLRWLWQRAKRGYSRGISDASFLVYFHPWRQPLPWHQQGRTGH